MSEHLINRPEAKSKNVDIKKRFAAIGATVALAVGLGACGEGNSDTEAMSESTAQSIDVIEEVAEEVVEEPEMIKLEESYEYTPVFTDAEIDYSLLDGFESLDERQKTLRAYEFFDRNGYGPLTEEDVEQSGNVGQAIIDNLMGRANLGYSVLSDMTDERNQEFGRAMLEYGVFYPGLNINDPETVSFEDFMYYADSTIEYLGRENSPFRYDLGEALAYSSSYRSESEGVGVTAVYVKSQGHVRTGYGKDQYGLFEFLVYVGQSYDSEYIDGLNGGHFHLVALSESGALDKRIFDNNEPTITIVN